MQTGPMVSLSLRAGSLKAQQNEGSDDVCAIFASFIQVLLTTLAPKLGEPPKTPRLCPKMLARPMRSYSKVLLLSLALFCEWTSVESFQHFGIALHRRCSLLHGCRAEGPLHIQNPRGSTPSCLLKMSASDGVGSTAEGPNHDGRDATHAATAGHAPSHHKQLVEDFAGPGTWILESEVECDVSRASVPPMPTNLLGQIRFLYFSFCCNKPKFCHTRSSTWHLQGVAHSHGTRTHAFIVLEHHNVHGTRTSIVFALVCRFRIHSHSTMV
jgi:hypothetical protein